MKKIKLNILLDKLLRTKLVEREYLYKLQKSILQNNNINFLKKNYILFNLNRLRGGKLKTTRNINTCLVTGSRHSIINNSNFCRQQNKRFIINNKLDNIKIFL